MASRTSTRAIHDPIRAHGAWVFLFAAAAAGSLVGAGQGVEPSLLVSTSFAGGFLAASALVVGIRRRARQLFFGAAVAIGSAGSALALGAEYEFLVVGVCAVVAGVVSVVLAHRWGLMSRSAIVIGLSAIVLAGPAAALAGDASPRSSTLLFFLIWPFFSWRTLSIAKTLSDGGAWDREALRERGLREAGLAAAWSLTVAALLRLLA